MITSSNPTPETTATAAAMQASAKDKAAADNRFRFTPIDDYRAAGFHSKEVQELLFKWGMQDHAWLRKFTYDAHFQPYELDAFLLALFNDAGAGQAMRVLGTRDRWARLGAVTRVDAEPTTHTVTSLAFFDKLVPGGPVIRRDGEIIKCLDEYHESFLVADELRKCLLVRDSDNYELFNDADRDEFIFCLFKALALGGKLCQYEDTLEPYLAATRAVYKDMISVAKDPQTQKLRVSSLVCRIVDVESAVSPLFPIRHPQNFCYVSIDPLKRTVHMMYHASDTFY
ncbi:hypothetical protein HDU87_007601 [Geranomyces variabilis]|uniref:Cilia- and flagella-associated protein 300 n=1 Tax=Geranomyces variabilis TaxID=109894 RepID=A0AAD5XJN5_9FUNG|nr:hypothetical protein HDU87_007601 [Geranomyces variabilis]